MIDKHEQMKQVRDDIVSCKACGLCATRTLPVIGRGNHDARILFVGEAPGENEDKQGIPFIGKAGIMLDKLLAKAKIDTKDIYICNVIKCRPPENRDPDDNEKLSCLKFLTRQIEIIKPNVIVCLGKHAASTVFLLFGITDKVISMSTMHGKMYEPDNTFKNMAMLVGDISSASVKICVVYHPAALLYNGALIQETEKDFENIKKYI
jgi:DNA polymerase